MQVSSPYVKVEICVCRYQQNCKELPQRTVIQPPFGLHGRHPPHLARQIGPASFKPAVCSGQRCPCRRYDTVSRCLPSWDTWILCRYYRCPATIVSRDLTLWMKCMGTGKSMRCRLVKKKKILVFDRYHKISPRQSSQD